MPLKGRQGEVLQARFKTCVEAATGVRPTIVTSLHLPSCVEQREASTVKVETPWPAVADCHPTRRRRRREVRVPRVYPERDAARVVIHEESVWSTRWRHRERTTAPSCVSLWRGFEGAWTSVCGAAPCQSSLWPVDRNRPVTGVFGFATKRVGEGLDASAVTPARLVGRVAKWADVIALSAEEHRRKRPVVLVHAVAVSRREGRDFGRASDVWSRGSRPDGTASGSVGVSRGNTGGSSWLSELGRVGSVATRGTRGSGGEGRGSRRLATGQKVAR